MFVSHISKLVYSSPLFVKHEKRSYQKVLQSLSRSVIDAKYAVRGAIPIRGEQIKQDMEAGNGDKYPFDNISAFNIGNP